MPKVIFAINYYLEQLRLVAPENVPTSAELSEAIGVDPTTFSRMAQNRTSGINKTHLAKLIEEFHRRGFDTTPNDLLRFVPDKSTD